MQLLARSTRILKVRHTPLPPSLLHPKKTALFLSISRFGALKIDYCEAIENKVALGDLELAGFCRSLRKAAKKTGIQLIVSYREIGRLAKFAELFGLPEALDSCVFKGALGKDDLNVLCNELTDTKYKRAMQNLMASC